MPCGMKSCLCYRGCSYSLIQKPAKQVAFPPVDKHTFGEEGLAIPIGLAMDLAIDLGMNLAIDSPMDLAVSLAYDLPMICL